MPVEQIIVNSRKYDQSIRRSWKCQLLERRGSMLKFVGIFASDVSHSDLGDIKRGTISYEYYWLDRWYNVFCFYEPDGTFRNYYCNINMPPTFADGILDYIDLDIDVVVWPDNSYKILDETEFHENAVRFGYPKTVRLTALTALGDVIKMIENRTLPS